MFGRPGKAERDAAFSAFMASATPSLMRTAWLLTGNGEAARELVQNAFVKTYAAWSRVDEGSALAYTRRVLVNSRTDAWRSTRLEVSTDTVPERSATGPEGGVDQRDAIARLLATLPEQQRKVVVLRYYCDLSEQQVADHLGLSLGAVKSTASRGLANLRASMTASSEGSLA